MMKELNFCRLTPSIICDQLVADEARKFMSVLIEKFGDMSGLELNWYLGKVRVVVPKFGIDYEQPAEVDHDVMIADMTASLMAKA